MKLTFVVTLLANVFLMANTSKQHSSKEVCTEDFIKYMYLYSCGFSAKRSFGSDGIFSSFNINMRREEIDRQFKLLVGDIDEAELLLMRKPIKKNPKERHTRPALRSRPSFLSAFLDNIGLKKAPPKPIFSDDSESSVKFRRSDLITVIRECCNNGTCSHEDFARLCDKK